MAISHVTKVFAITDCKVAAMTADVTTAPTYDTAVDVPGIKTIGLTFDMKNTELRGDNRRIESDTVLVGCQVTFDHAKLSLDALEVILGGTATDAGTGTTETVTFARAGTDALPYFKLEAATPTSGVDVVGGDLHLVVHKLKVSNYNLGFAEEDYQTFSAEAVGVFTVSSDELFRIVINETAAAIS